LIIIIFNKISNNYLFKQQYHQQSVFFAPYFEYVNCKFLLSAILYSCCYGISKWQCALIGCNMIYQYFLTEFPVIASFLVIMTGFFTVRFGQHTLNEGYFFICIIHNEQFTLYDILLIMFIN
jgi:hypothetical protein